MIKKLIEEIKEKGTTTRDKKAKLNKLYPREYCFFGGCNRKVSEDGINYECYHREIFLADDDIAPTTFKCLSKDIDSESVIEIKAVKSGTLEYTYTILDNGEEYNVSICSANSLSEPNKKWLCHTKWLIFS